MVLRNPGELWNTSRHQGHLYLPTLWLLVPMTIGDMVFSNASELPQLVVKLDEADKHKRTIVTTFTCAQMADVLEHPPAFCLRVRRTKPGRARCTPLPLCLLCWSMYPCFARDLGVPGEVPFHCGHVPAAHRRSFPSSGNHEHNGRSCGTCSIRPSTCRLSAPCALAPPPPA
jgi:hypothetical protein